jgi:hypothetical protein
VHIFITFIHEIFIYLLQEISTNAWNKIVTMSPPSSQKRARRQQTYDKVATPTPPYGTGATQPPVTGFTPPIVNPTPSVVPGGSTFPPVPITGGSNPPVTFVPPVTPVQPTPSGNCSEFVLYKLNQIVTISNELLLNNVSKSKDIWYTHAYVMLYSASVEVSHKRSVTLPLI